MPSSLARSALPLALLVGLLALTAIQVWRDLGAEPPYDLESGLAVRHRTLDAEPNDTLPMCRPSPDVIAELSEMHFDSDVAPCDGLESRSVVLEAWQGGRLVWHRDDALEFQRW